jgi:hypothetical protein
MSKLDSSDTRDHVFDWPLFPKNIEKFETGRTDMNAIRNGIRGFFSVHIFKEFRIDEVGMVCRMAQKDFREIERLFGSIPFKPPLVKIFFKRIRVIPFPRFPFLILS